MSCTHYYNNMLFIEDVNLHDVANTFGTPTYVYSRAAIQANWKNYEIAFSGIPHRICYAVKANSNIAILNLLKNLNAGFDIVSRGELERVLAAGGSPDKIIYSGVGKTIQEIEYAIKKAIYCFNVESVPELERLHAIAAHLNKKVSIALRINPNINPQTHSHISTGMKENKFGIELDDIPLIIEKLQSLPFVSLIGIAAHIGSQITTLSPFILMIECLLTIYHQLTDLQIPLKHIDIGGGLGITYKHENPPDIQTYAQALKNKLVNCKAEIILEPGRAIVGNAGILLTKVEYLKHTQYKNFAIVDAGMNDLIRPALYDAWQNILSVTLHEGIKKEYDITGPVCESADFIGKNRSLILHADDLLAIDSAGAYGFSMSSNYNSRCKPAEVLIDGKEMHLIRKRESITTLFSEEQLLNLMPLN